MAIRSFGVAVTIDSTAIGGLVSADITGGDVSFIDTTTHESADGYREFVGGLKDGGTLELSGKYEIADAGQVKLRNPAVQGLVKAAELTFSDGSTATFDVVVGVPSHTNPLDEDVQWSCSCKITGNITFAAAV